MAFAYYNISTTDKTTISAVDTIVDTLALQGPPKSMTICNSTVVANTCAVDLYIVSQFGTDIRDTGTDANEIDNYATSSSVTLTVDGTGATDSIFKNEKVWKSDGTLFGTCTSVTNTTTLVFSGGIEQTLANNDSLYTGSKYYILRDAYIPARHTLVLEESELNYDSTIYSLVFVLRDVSSSQIIDIKVKY